MLGFLKNRQPKAGDKAGEQVKLTGANEMTNVLGDLDSTNKKYGSKNGLFNKRDSDEYVAVKAAIWEVLDKTRGDFSSNAEANDKMLMDAQASYGRLAQRCTKYLGKAGGKTQSGRMRKQKVKMILDMAVQDSERIEYYRRENRLMSNEERSEITWQEITHSAREALIEVEDITKYTALGAGVKTGDKAARLLNNGVFAREEISNAKDVAGGFRSSSFNVKDGVGEDAVIKEGEKLNLSGRNVATSRVAKLLGVEGIVEESATVKVKDKKTNTVIKGNLMSIAKGDRGDKAEATVKKHAVTAENDNLEKRNKAVEAKIGGTVRKELASLQVLDYICGQGDRHTKNFFLEADSEGIYRHVHAIDNDMAFGTGVDFEKYLRDTDGITQNKLKMVVDSQNKLTIPHMDKQLAMNIKNLSPDELRFVIEDIVEPKFIDAAIQRLNKLKEGIKKEEATPTGIFVENESDWDKNHNDFIKNSKDQKSLEMFKAKGLINDDFGKMNWDNVLTVDEKIETMKSSSYYSTLVEGMLGFGGAYFQRKLGK